MSTTFDVTDTYDVPSHFLNPESKSYQTPHIQGFENYLEKHAYSIEDNESFWREEALNRIDWFSEFTQVKAGSFENGDVRWFLNGKLNVSYNCIDRHLPERENDVAIIYEGNEVDDVRHITYGELQRKTSQVANVLKRYGVKKGDVVCIYMPMCPEVAYTMLACARIGAPHSVVFAGFSADSLASRIEDANCKIVVTADGTHRANRTTHLKDAVDEAILSCPFVETVLVLKHTGINIAWHDNRDVWLEEAMQNEKPYCPPEWMDSEDTLFLLYTSGSTGKPKGVVHTQAGYLCYTSITHQYIFDYHKGDVYGCMADVGWITGHSYIIYGPLANGATTVMFESTPVYPDAGRYWDMVERHKISVLYTAPTAIRALMAQGDEWVNKYDLSSLRVLGTVGEPINPPAWKWYFEVVGKGNVPIVDTMWQTETGGIVFSSLPGCTVMKPGSTTFGFFGVSAKVLDQTTGEEIEGNDVNGVLAIKDPWPSVTRTVWGNHERYLNCYLRPYPGYYFTGDGCYRDKDGYIWITGRVDDVINVSGHRLGTAEIEGALVTHPYCTEAAIITIPHEIKGNAIVAYCVLAHGSQISAQLIIEMKLKVREKISPIATPDKVYFVTGLPKTRSGKIMRRLLRKIAENDPDLGDISTLADTSVVDNLLEATSTQIQ